MDNKQSILHSYGNGDYLVSIFRDGTKVRVPVNSTHQKKPPLPEQMDLKITDWCDGACAWCHEKSTTKGTHGELDSTLTLLQVLPAGAEIAIGGGDPLSHPNS